MQVFGSAQAHHGYATFAVWAAALSVYWRSMFLTSGCTLGAGDSVRLHQFILGKDGVLDDLPYFTHSRVNSRSEILLQPV